MNGAEISEGGEFTWKEYIAEVSVLFMIPIAGQIATLNLTRSLFGLDLGPYEYLMYFCHPSIFRLLLFDKLNEGLGNWWLFIQLMNWICMNDYISCPLMVTNMILISISGFPGIFGCFITCLKLLIFPN